MEGTRAPAHVLPMQRGCWLTALALCSSHLSVQLFSCVFHSCWDVGPFL